MNRKSLDRLISWIGISLTVMLIVAGGLLTWAGNFVENEVHTQLAQQQVFFPPAGSPAIAGPEYAVITQYAGQQLTTGAQAEAYADHFVAVHLTAIGGSKTYAQLSTAARSAPTDTKLAATVDSMFKGETLRGLLLNAYAFGTMGTIAGIAAIGAFMGALAMLLLSALGLWHSRRVPPAPPIQSAVGEPKRVPVAV